MICDRGAFVVDSSAVDSLDNTVSYEGTGGILYGQFFSWCWPSGRVVRNSIDHCGRTAIGCRGGLDSPMDVRDNTITGGADSWGIQCEGEQDSIEGNTIRGVGPCAGFIGIWVACPVTCGSPTIKGNTIVGCAAGGIVCRTGTSPTIDGNTFDGNSAPDGGAICLGGVTSTVIKNNLFIHNRASGEEDLGGGAIYAEDSEARIVNNTFVENCVGTLTEGGSFPAPGSDIWADVELEAFGGAVHVTGPNQTTRRVTLVNNIFYDNRAGEGDGVAGTAYGLADVSYCAAYRVTDPPGSQSNNYTHSANSECNPGTGLLYLDPSFSNPAAGYYWLQSSSGARGQGTTLTYNTSDINGFPRPGTDSAYDMGAYESEYYDTPN